MGSALKGAAKSVVKAATDTSALRALRGLPDTPAFRRIFRGMSGGGSDALIHFRRFAEGLQNIFRGLINRVADFATNPILKNRADILNEPGAFLKRLTEPLDGILKMADQWFAKIIRFIEGKKDCLQC